jgi:hypothetical protein
MTSNFASANRSRSGRRPARRRRRPQRLEEVDGESEVATARGDLLGSHRRGGQVGVEQLDAGEVRGRDGLELVLQRPRHETVAMLLRTAS